MLGAHASHLLRMSILVGLAMGTGACVTSPLEGLRCSEDSQCPRGQYCQLGGFCSSSVLDAAPPPDAEPDPDAQPDEVQTLISTPLRLSDSPGNSLSASIAWTGSGYGVAWSEDLDGNSEIFFATIDLSGQAGPATRITMASGFSAAPSLIWMGSAFALAWHDNRDEDSEIYFVRLSPDGQKLSPELRITDDPASSYNPKLAWTGQAYGLLWQDRRSGEFDIYFRLLTPEGMPKVAGEPIRITDSPTQTMTANLAWTGSAFGVVYIDTRETVGELVFRRLDADGMPQASELQLTDEGTWASSPVVAWVKDRFVIAWAQPDPSHPLGGVRVAAVGSGGGEIGTPTYLTGTEDDANAPAIAWTGSELAIAWHVDREGDAGSDLFLARLNEAGTLLGTVPATSSTSKSFNLSLIWTGDRYAFAWTDDRPGNLEVYMREAQTGECEDNSDCLESQCIAFACTP